MRSYIGITGFMTRFEVEEVLKSMPLQPNQLLMVGVLANKSTLDGIPHSKTPNRYPRKEEIPEIFKLDERVINLIHYSTPSQDTLLSQLLALVNDFTVAGKKNVLRGFQLNIAWPSPSALKEFRRLFPQKIIVLQIGWGAFLKVNFCPKVLAEKIAQEYASQDLIDYILLDPSGGQGKNLQIDQIELYLSHLEDQKLNIGMGIAGGLSPDTISTIRPLIEKFPCLSIDSEGRLRNSEDHLDINIARTYVDKALEIFACV